jgi:transposase
MVFERQAEHESQWAAIVSIAGKIGCTPESLRKWVRQSERDQGKRAGLTSTEQERLKQLERENLELKRANEILRKAAAFSPRRNSTADRSDGGVYRSAPSRVWGRADLRAVADRPIDLLRAQGARGSA